MKVLKKPFAYASIFGMLLTGGFTYSILKTFVISEPITTVSASNA
ncbi:phosphodiester glycosidase family protein, partial [Streptococcus suis]